MSVKRTLSHHTKCLWNDRGSKQEYVEFHVVRVFNTTVVHSYRACQPNKCSEWSSDVVKADQWWVGDEDLGRDTSKEKIVVSTRRACMSAFSVAQRWSRTLSDLFMRGSSLGQPNAPHTLWTTCILWSLTARLASHDMGLGGTSVVYQLAICWQHVRSRNNNPAMVGPQQNFPPGQRDQAKRYPSAWPTMHSTANGTCLGKTVWETPAEHLGVVQ